MSRRSHKPFYQLIAGNLLIVIVVFTVAEVVSYRSLDAQYLRDVEAHQHQVTGIARQFVERLWPLPDSEMDVLCKRLAGAAPSEAPAGGAAPAPTPADPAMRFTVLAADGRVLGDSQGDPTTMANHKTSDRPEVLQALEGRTGQDTRRSETLAVPFRYVALPLHHEGRLVGAVRTAMPVLAISQAETVMRDTVVWTAIIAVVAFALVGLLVNWVWYQTHKGPGPGNPPDEEE